MEDISDGNLVLEEIINQWFSCISQENYKENTLAHDVHVRRYVISNLNENFSILLTIFDDRIFVSNNKYHGEWESETFCIANPNSIKETVDLLVSLD